MVLASSAGATPAEQELRDSIRPLVPQVDRLVPGPAAPVVERRGRGQVSLSADVLFDFDRAAVRPAGRRAAQRLAGRIVVRAGVLRVVGHSDGLGDEDYNRRLSLRRARAVAATLSSAVPDGVRILAVGRGDLDPVADETTPSGDDDPVARARNRRVELRFTAR